MEISLGYASRSIYSHFLLFLFSQNVKRQLILSRKCKMRWKIYRVEEKNKTTVFNINSIYKNSMQRICHLYLILFSYVYSCVRVRGMEYLFEGRNTMFAKTDSQRITAETRVVNTNMWYMEKLNMNTIRNELYLAWRTAVMCHSVKLHLTCILHVSHRVAT